MVHTSTHPQSLHNPQHESSRPLMEFRDFCFAYEDRPVLSHIDLTIDAGDSEIGRASCRERV